MDIAKLEYRLSELERKYSALQEENDTLKRDAKIFYGALDIADQKLKRIDENIDFLNSRIENVKELSFANQELGQILANRDRMNSDKIDALKFSSDSLQFQIEKFIDAYYRVFPDRLDQDCEFKRQMDAIEKSSRGKRPPDAASEKP